MRYKTTTKGTKLPDRWQLPDEIRDDTGILFTSAFPGYDAYEFMLAPDPSDASRKRWRLNVSFKRYPAPVMR